MVKLIPVDSARWAYCCELFGMFYLVVSMSLSIYCLDLFSPYLQNDFFWPGFVDMNTSQVISSIFNTQLSLATSGTIDLFNPSTALVLLPTNFQINPTYARLVFYRDLTAIESAIEGLRRLELQQVTYMQSPYCWLDMNRRWSTAHSQLRQLRCEKLYQHNGAVYLEAVLRNIDFLGWLALNYARFYDRIGRPIQELNGGSLWLTQLLHHSLLTVQDEADIWTSHNLNYFALQYANAVKLGIEETITIENAMGLIKSYRIKSLPSTGSIVWTTAAMYGPIEYDFVGLPPNQSFIRNTSNFWADIDQTALEVFNAGDPLSPVNQVIHDQIGPLMNIDIRWIIPPPSLITTVQTFRSKVLNLLSTDIAFQSMWSTLKPLKLTPTPAQWKNLLSYGGNPMCYSGAPLYFVQQSFAFDDACGSQTPLTLTAHQMNALFAATIVSKGLASTCMQCLPNEQADCINQANTLTRMALQVSLPNFSYSNIEELDISYLQFVAPVTNTTNISIRTQPLLASNWVYFGFMSMYDWAMNEKEVVGFEGDASSIYLMSSSYAPVNSRVSTLKSTLAIYLWYLSAMMTIVLVVLASLLIMWWIVTIHTDCQWFNFNRLVGSVWLSRSILFIRSTAAMVCLATAPAQPFNNGILLLLANNTRSWFISCLLASETTWLTYVCQEVIQPAAFSLPTRYTHINSFIAWLIISYIDIFIPVQPSAYINRQCHSMNMATMVYCSSGYLQIGFTSRVVLIAVINIAVCLVCTCGILLTSKGAKAEDTSLLISAAAMSCLWDTNAFRHHLNPIVSAMCGLITFKVKDTKHSFDTKLWLHIVDQSIEYEFVLPFVTQARSTSSSSMIMLFHRIKTGATLHNFGVIIGFTYLTFTLMGNIAYLSIAKDTLANDFFWAGFNSTGMHTFIANLYNKQVLLTPKVNVQLDNPSFGDWANLYSGVDSNIVWGANTARRQLFSTKTSLHDHIQGLRAMTPNQLPWMFTQYCWLDFNRTWEMATTSRRQTRCLDAFSNGALYLESGLRNIMDWNQWENSWGTSFNISFRIDLESSNSGRAWLNKIQTNGQFTIEDEVVYWQRHGIKTFELQWQNYKSLGMSDTILIENALGLQYPLQISFIEGSFHTHQQTSFRLYWTLASDLWAVSSNISSISGKSLLRSSPRFAFVNRTSESLLYENFTLTAPLRSGLVSFRDIIGPFNAVDTKYIQCPASVLDFFGDTMAAFTTLLAENILIQNAYLNLSVPGSTFEAPGVLLNDTTAVVVGGNIMCGDDNAAYPASVALFQFFGADVFCFEIIAEQMYMNKMEMTFALMAFNWTYIAIHSDFNAICGLNDAAMSSCQIYYNDFFTFMQKFTSSLATLESLSHKAYKEVQAMSVEITQYVIYNGSSHQLFHMNIFNQSDRPWGFYGWCLVYEWITGGREVVSFQGDNGTITAISHYTPPLTLAPDPVQIPVSFSFFGQYSSQYITIVIICVAALLVVNTFVVRGQIEGYN
ncbi:hypothetical protein THRCLA_20046, partial [Thraustotheca clavata]